MATMNDATYFPKISEMIQQVYEISKKKNTSMDECLHAYIRTHKYWPMIQTKRFFGNRGLVLMHNTYKRDDVDHFKDLYDEVRSVVLDLNAPAGENIVLSLADKIPTRMDMQEYQAHRQDTDICEKGYEGTMMYVYHHNDRWFFGTSTCPSVDGSRYFHPTKTHGEMLNEVLATYFPEVVEETVSPKENGKKLREAFTQHLSTDKSYGFMLVHHENRHFMNYTEELGENYKVLFHVFTRDKTTKGTTVDTEVNLSSIGVKYIPTYGSVDEGLTALQDEKMYALIVRRDNEMLKISRPELIQKETRDLGNANPWMNMLWVYMQNKPNYQVNDYMEEYLAEKKDTLEVRDSQGRVMAPVYIIHTAMCTLRDMLYSLYGATTYYNTYTQKYTMNLAMDQQLPPILRFHLAQLRNIQVTTHKHAPINSRAIYHYLCYHQTLKNIRLLIAHFANNPYNMPYRAVECFSVLGSNLHA